MRMAIKQLTKQLGKNKVFLFLLFLLMLLTSLSYFFAKFSIDGNLAVLNRIDDLSENQLLYHQALTSNNTLASIFLASLTGLTTFAIIIFFYRFYRANQSTMGCLKALGFLDGSLRSFFTAFIGVLSAFGGVLGMGSGYFLSSVLIEANQKTYSVTGLVKEIDFSSLFIGIVGSTVVFCLTAFFCFAFIRGKETAILLSGHQNTGKTSGALKTADRIVNILPVKNKFSLRIALRKPISVALIFVAVMSFSVCVILGRSLNISSQKVFQMQTIGHYYEYETLYPNHHTGDAPKGSVAYLKYPTNVNTGSNLITQDLIGIYEPNPLYRLQENANPLSSPDEGTIYINPGIAKMYGVRVGDVLSLTIADTRHDFLVNAIVDNAKPTAIYLNAAELSSLLTLPSGAFNGLLSVDSPPPGGITTSKAQRIATLERNATSNQVSAVINQVTGAIVGSILIFLALFLNFQDNTHDILILHMLGYQMKEIRSTLVDIYRSIIWAAFFLTLIPSILLAQAIQTSLSITTGDYMPFGTGVGVVIFTFILLSLIDWAVRSIFSFGIKRVIEKQNITQCVAFES